jgi:hypothetical protein
MFKYTSNQRAIKRVRNRIKANLLALKLFKDSASVALTAQGRILWGAAQLFALSLVPMVIMLVPVVLLVAQLAQWYQFRPLRAGEEAVLTLRLSGKNGDLPEVRLAPSDAIDVELGPVRVLSQHEANWSIRAKDQPGLHRLVFHVGDLAAEKALAIGQRDGESFMRVSPLRPSWNWSDALLYPAEKPFSPDSAIQSIEITYPDRESWTSGTDLWLVYWFIASMVAAFLFKPLLNVNI